MAVLILDNKFFKYSKYYFFLSKKNQTYSLDQYCRLGLLKPHGCSCCLVLILNGGNCRKPLLGTGQSWPLIKSYFGSNCSLAHFHLNIKADGRVKRSMSCQNDCWLLLSRNRPRMKNEQTEYFQDLSYDGIRFLAPWANLFWPRIGGSRSLLYCHLRVDVHYSVDNFAPIGS